MFTRDLIESLRDIVADYDEPNGMDFYFDAIDAEVVTEAANRLEELESMLDDILGDHYIDYLEFYTNRCRDLEERLSDKNNI